jgi:hypothetical protein
MQRRHFLLSSMAGLALLPFSASAISWVKLGESRIEVLADFAIIPVGLTEGLFSHIRLEVSGSDIFVRSLRVIFSNGERADLTVASLIRRGRSSQPLALPGRARAIRQIELFYTRGLRSGQATVVVNGLRIARL